MELSKIERLMLANQFLILEKLYPAEADGFAQHRKAVEAGYALHYNWMFQSMGEGLTEKECEEVVRILNMYRSLEFSYRRLSDDEKREIPYSAIIFPGFSDDEEARRLLYVSYWLDDLRRFDELQAQPRDTELITYTPMLDRYRSMLTEWEPLRGGEWLTKEQILSILRAGRRLD